MTTGSQESPVWNGADDDAAVAFLFAVFPGSF